MMYGFANRITPEALEDIACWLYIEMLEAGYTSVCEFHYLHHGEGGQPYADDATLSLDAATQLAAGRAPQVQAQLLRAQPLLWELRSKFLIMILPSLGKFSIIWVSRFLHR